MNKQRNVPDKRTSQLPNWLWSSSNSLPAVYRRVWESVREDQPHSTNQSESLVDTKKIFPILLTSQLPTEVLGYIWSLANQKYAGQLTEQELYVVLALVATAQASLPFTSLEALHFWSGAPEPRLDFAPSWPASNRQLSLQQRDSSSFPHDFPDKYEIQSRSGGKTSSSACAIGIPGLIANNSHIGETKIDSKVQIGGGTLQPKIQIADNTEIRTVQTEGKLFSHCSSPSFDSGDDFSEFQSAPVPQVAPSIPMLDSKQGSAIGSRLANHNLGVSKKPGDRPKKTAGNSSTRSHAGSRTFSPIEKSNSNPIAPISGKESPLTTGERLTDLFPKCPLKNQAKTVILKDTAIRNNDPPKTRDIPAISGKNASSILNNSPQDLMNLQQIEDKYSALRVLVAEPKIGEIESPVASIAATTSALSLSDDFGDFVSAEQTIETPATDNSSIFDAKEIVNDLFSDFEQFRADDAATKKSIIADISANREVGDALANLEISGASPDRHSLDEKYDGNSGTEKVVQKEDAISVNSIELGNGTIGVMTRSSSVPSLDLKSFLSPSLEDEQQQVENMHQLIYWEWKQYMESCVLLLQTATNVFNSITSASVLQEVIASAQGYNFLCNLAEVAAVCRRVNFSHKEMDINIMGFDDLLMDIDRIWAEMEPYYANIPIVTELPVWPLNQSENSSCCALCLTVVTSGRIVYNDNNYHATCANLWLNCVNQSLPALRYPSLSSTSFHSHAFPIASTGNNQI